MGGCQNHKSVTPARYKTNGTRIIGGASSVTKVSFLWLLISSDK